LYFILKKKRFCQDNRKAQKYLLGGFEKLVGDVYVEKLFPQAVRIMKEFYDHNILDEETLIEWSGKESKKYVSKDMSRKIHEKVAPLIKWLKEAEEEEDSSSEDGEDCVSKSTNSKTPSVDIEEEDDFELDFSHKANGIEIKEEVVVARFNPVLVEKGRLDEVEAATLDDDEIDEI